MTATHTPGQTTETPRRAPQDFNQPTHHVSLDAECDGLLEEAGANPSRRAAKTLSKDPSMTVALLAMRGGAEIKDHRAHGSALLQVIRGDVTVSLKAGHVSLSPGHVLALASQVPHGLTTTVDSVVLLVVAADQVTRTG